MTQDTDPLLTVRDLTTVVGGPDGGARVVDAVSFELQPGESLGIVGESGSGKSMTCASIMGLLPRQARRAAGEVVLQGRHLTQLGEHELRRVRGRDMAMIPQDPLTSLNPAHTIGAQVAESLRVHSETSRAEARARTVDLLRQVGIGDAAERARQYPHQLSGGMRQRVAAAIAIACRPALLIADEPTTGLDVTTQALLVRLLKRIQREVDCGILFVSHDVGVVASVCERIAVMYAGRIVESGRTKDVLAASSHPYTRGLLRCLPSLDDTRRPVSLPGAPPDPSEILPGCPFAPRCSLRIDECELEVPPLTGDGDHLAACIRQHELATPAARSAQS